MKTKIFPTASLLLALLLIITGCGKTAPPTAESLVEATSSEESILEPKEEINEEALPYEVFHEIIDRHGNVISLPSNINNIISTAPATTQIILDLGLGDSLVAVDSFSQGMFEELSTLPAFDMMSPDIEQIILQEPDIIFTSIMNTAGGDNPFAPLIDKDIALVGIDTASSIDEIQQDIQFVADCLSVGELGQSLVDTMNQELADIEAIASTIKEKKTVFFEVSPLPDLYSFGSGTYLNEMIELLGAENILADQESWLAVSEEVVLAANPDVILTNADYLPTPVEEILSREGWQAISAIKNNTVALIDNNSSSQPNHHIIAALKEMAKAIYPEYYAG